MPTGGGKTICFTLPALVSNGLSIVVVPTLSLMQDIYVRLKVFCTCICFSSLDSDKDLILHNIISTDVKFLICTPESLEFTPLVSCLQKVSVARLILDECHCLDQWGFQFRPAYLKLVDFRQAVKCPCICLTATATSKTLDVIKRLLCMEDAFIIKHSFNRPNLYLHVLEKVSLKQVCNDIINLCKTSYSDQSVIIYCLSPRDCKTVCCNLLEEGVQCVSYHGDMSPFEKSDNFSKWKRGDVNIIVATKSLGMGIDKSNVRCICHVSFPSSIPDYYQQVGRAGRDGDRADCFLYFKFSDRSLHLEHISKIDSEIQRNNAYRELKDIITLCINFSCVTVSVLKYFDEEMSGPCKRCSTCIGTVENQDISSEARQCLLLLQGLGPLVQNKVSFHLLAKVMCGSKDKEIKDKNLNLLPLYHCCKKPLKHVERLLHVLWTKNVLHEDKRCVSPGLRANDVLLSTFTVKMTCMK